LYTIKKTASKNQKLFKAVPQLAEDVTFRIQEILKRALKHAKRCRRGNISGNDFDHVVEEMGKEPFTGIRPRSTRQLNIAKNETVFVNIPETISMPDFNPDKVKKNCKISFFEKNIREYSQIELTLFF